ncbi:MAG: hypothetical protein Q9192_001027 [Flavoplaca navasiana]
MVVDEEKEPIYTQRPIKSKEAKASGLWRLDGTKTPGAGENAMKIPLHGIIKANGETDRSPRVRMVVG